MYDLGMRILVIACAFLAATGDKPSGPVEFRTHVIENNMPGGYTVIIDAPPLLPVTDAAVLTASADGALIAVSAGETLDTQLSAALGALNAVQGHTLGVVLNRVPPKAANTGYYGGYYAAEQRQPELHLPGSDRLGLLRGLDL